MRLDDLNKAFELMRDAVALITASCDDDEQSELTARMQIFTALQFAMPPISSQSSENPLLDLAFRLQLAAPLIDSGAGVSVSELVEELYAVANGDAPKLFAKRRSSNGKRANSWRLARHQLRALAWERFLRAKGMAAGKAQDDVSSAFGTPWATIRQWSNPLVQMHGAGWVQHVMKAATHAGRNGLCNVLVMNALAPPHDFFDLASDGDGYLRELGCVRP